MKLLTHVLIFNILYNNVLQVHAEGTYMQGGLYGAPLGAERCRTVQVTEWRRWFLTNGSDDKVRSYLKMTHRA